MFSYPLVAVVVLWVCATLFVINATNTEYVTTLPHSKAATIEVHKALVFGVKP